MAWTSSAPSSHRRAGRARPIPATGRRINSRLAQRHHRHGRGQEPRHRMAGGAGHRRAQGQLPAAGLAAVAPTILGLPHSGGALPGSRHRRGPGGRAACPAARRRGVPSDRRVAPALPRGFPAHHLPHLRRPGGARDRHHGHLRGLVLVLRALLRSVGRGSTHRRGRGQPLDAG